MSRAQYQQKSKNKSTKFMFDNIQTVNDCPVYMNQSRMDTPSFLEKQKDGMKTNQTRTSNNQQNRNNSESKCNNLLKSSSKQFKTLKKMSKNYENIKQRPPTKSHSRPKTSFHSSRVAFDDLEKYQTEQKLKKVSSTCQKLAYTIGHLQAQLKQTIKQCDYQKQKRLKETKYLLLLVQKYKCEAQKYKEIFDNKDSQSSQSKIKLDKSIIKKNKTKQYF